MRTALRHRNSIALKPEQVASFEMQFVPKFDALFNCTLKLHIVDNPYESILVINKKQIQDVFLNKIFLAFCRGAIVQRRGNNRRSSSQNNHHVLLIHFFNRSFSCLRLRIQKLPHKHFTKEMFQNHQPLKRPHVQISICPFEIRHFHTNSGTFKTAV